MSRSANAELIAIGTELLLGEIVDTNSAAIAQRLSVIGLDLYRTTAVGDNIARIADAVSGALTRAVIVITTGGLGPTEDDVTREGIARALDLELEFRDQLWDQIVARFKSLGVKPTENNRRQAQIPAGATALPNPVGTAPGFLIETDGLLLAALPGVTSEMERMLAESVLPAIERRFGQGGVIRSLILRTAGVGESWLDSRLADLSVGANPTLGLAAHPGRVDIRITAKAVTAQNAESLIENLASQIRARVGEHIYAEGPRSLEQALVERSADLGARVIVFEAGTRAALARGLADAGGAFHSSTVLGTGTSWADLENHARSHGDLSRDLVLLVQLSEGHSRRRLRVQIEYAGQSVALERTFRGQAVDSDAWAASLVLKQALELIDKVRQKIDD